ncbi:NADP-dependent oxidoreductase [Agrococcus versicolor]|uniref:NADP-dependent oxidoreductase n=1 Tax=Agrococcus versicolor TaxID=501482 RepID=A0ABP5MBV9_9MICO
MRAFAVTRYGQPMTEIDAAEPVVGEDDVLIRVEAAGLNHIDERIRSGDFRQILPYRLPQVLGADVAGTVVRVGARVRDLQPGDAVFASPASARIGAFAERIAVRASEVAPRPASVDVVEAGSLPLVALTAWQALVERGRVQPGQRVLVHAGAGGVGTIAIQLAKHLGATVATTASAANADLVRSLGADVVIDYRSEDFGAILHDYDLVLDSLGGENLERSLRVLRPGGIAIGIAGPPDPAFARSQGLPLPVRLVIRVLSARIRRLARRLGVRYEFLFMRADGAQLREIAALVDAGVIRPIVDRVVDLDDVPSAVEGLGSGGGRGKRVVRVAG